MATSKQNLFQVINAAIDELSRTGYDNVERVAYWSEQIRIAAEQSTKSVPQMMQMLREALEGVYKRLVERGGVIQRAPGVSRFTIQKVAPELRAELNRRIMASASLIKLNRDEAIDKTIRRFQGWATSLPPGGSAEPDKQKAKKDVKKSVAGLPFQERRVLIDQGHKLGAAITATVAQGGGAIAAIWHSNFRQAGYDYRPDHKHRDGEVYLLRDSWARTEGLVKTGAAGYSDAITQPAEEPYCRCRFEYLFHLRQLPDDMMTKKGHQKLEAVRIKN